MRHIQSLVVCCLLAANISVRNIKKTVSNRVYRPNNTHNCPTQHDAATRPKRLTDTNSSFQDARFMPDAPTPKNGSASDISSAACVFPLHSSASEHPRRLACYAEAAVHGAVRKIWTAPTRPSECHPGPHFSACSSASNVRADPAASSRGAARRSASHRYIKVVELHGT